jgi:2,3-bisphosphoglycerate-dependent phosphoglycerate mutase
MTSALRDDERILVLLRHGESTWNRENRFSGWTDVDLTDRGIAEAHAAARSLRQAGSRFDVAFTSVLKRAVRTLWIVLDDLDLMWIPVHRSWRLNERHYGALQGLRKSETAERLGEELVHTWRRSYRVRPPALEPEDDRARARDERYAHTASDLLPRTESLADTIERVLPYWQGEIAPRLEAGQRVLLVAHGNSLRALVKHLDHMGDEAIAGLNIPTGAPLLYHLDGSLRPIEHRYLGDAETIAAAEAAVAAQGRARKDIRGARADGVAAGHQIHARCAHR